MEILTPGHRYQLSNFENQTVSGQILQFIEKIPSETEPTKLITVNDGTTNEEVLVMLIDRLQFLQDKFPCYENGIAILRLTEALLLLMKRTQDRQARNVEGKATL